ncbi:hypothetical protein LY78DRAFT_171744 [Colletotrichum sublineola]|nr:hypothetical protein LY78DRAFT_171744 [Colletotrichum sublineola]
MFQNIEELVRFWVVEPPVAPENPPCSLASIFGFLCILLLRYIPPRCSSPSKPLSDVVSPYWDSLPSSSSFFGMASSAISSLMSFSLDWSVIFCPCYQPSSGQVPYGVE